MKKTICVFTMLLGCLACASLAASEKPNIILIMADDLGMECVESYGGLSYKTPNIDQLARDGMRFKNCFSCPYCSPSRAQILTGRYPLHTGITRVIFKPKSHREFLDPQKETSFASLLKNAGYRTAIAGKWQLSFLNERNTIPDFGFDEYQCWQIFNNDIKTSRYADPAYLRNGKLLQEELNGKYGPDLNCEFLIDFMQRNKKQPFLIYWTMLLPHFPYEQTPDSGQVKNAGKKPGQGPEYFDDMVAYLDQLVGRIVQAVEKEGLSDNTIIIFTADNGTQSGRNIVSYWTDGEKIFGIPGGKAQLTDTGTHVPLIVRWPARIKRNSLCEDLVDLSDILPTLVDLAGAKLPATPINGFSFAKQLLGKPANSREYVHIQKQGVRYVRSKNFILTNQGNFRPVVLSGRPAAEDITKKLTAKQTEEKENLQNALRQSNLFLSAD